MSIDVYLLAAAASVVDVLDDPPEADFERLSKLVLALNSVMLAVGSPEKGPYGVGPTDEVPDDGVLRERFGAAFPEFGMYPVAPGTLEDWERTPDCTMGDAIDDLVDIYRDISECLALARAKGEAAGAELLRQSFAYHWGEHARLLQLHVHRLLYALG